MIVPVDASAHRGDTPVTKDPEALADVSFALQHPLGIALHGWWQGFQPPTEEPEGLTGLPQHALVESLPVKIRPGFWGKTGVVRGLGEGHVQFAGALAQEPGTLQVGANEAVHGRWGTRVEQGEQRLLGHGGGSDVGLPCWHLREVAPYRVLGVSPGIPERWQEDLQHG